MSSPQEELEQLEREINAFLPPLYRDRFEKVEPVSMGSASLKFGPDGKVAWDEIWTTFCDLALAGGPPHRGTLLEPATEAEVRAEPDAYQRVTEEIGRGIWMVTWLHVLPMAAPGWIAIFCRGEAMAAWLTRAIVAENVSARHEGDKLFLPAGPGYRLEKEIKNVVTALAKTNHYWSDHLTSDQRGDVAEANARLGVTAVAPATADQIEADSKRHEAAAAALEHAIAVETGLSPAPRRAAGWIGFHCQDEAQAVWLLRAVSVSNVLVWREKASLFLPVPAGSTEPVLAAAARACRLWRVHQQQS